MNPLDVGSADVLAFLHRVLPAPPLRVLEVGCGRGDIAAGLMARGYEVTALDADEEAVATARAAGVPAERRDFLDGVSGTYGAVLFIRSLHHMADLDRAVALAIGACEPGGVVVVDEMARERIDALTAAWFSDVRSLLGAAGVLAAPDWSTTGDPMARWEAEYGVIRAHRLHTATEVAAAIGSRLRVERAEPCAYLYRHLAQWLEPSERGLAVAEQLLTLERERIDRDELAPLGLRLVARRAD